MKSPTTGLGMTKEQVEGMFMDKPHVKSEERASGLGCGKRQ